MPTALRAGLAYFALVFAVGFVLGPVRVLWAVPRFGERTAELLEAPFMVLAIVLAARFTVGRFSLLGRPGAAARAGALAVALLAVAEMGVALALRGLSPADYVASRDPVSGSVYLALVALFGVLPWRLARAGAGARPETGP